MLLHDLVKSAVCVICFYFKYFVISRNQNIMYIFYRIVFLSTDLMLVLKLMSVSEYV